MTLSPGANVQPEALDLAIAGGVQGGLQFDVQ